MQDFTHGRCPVEDELHADALTTALLFGKGRLLVTIFFVIESICGTGQRAEDTGYLIMCASKGGAQPAHSLLAALPVLEAAWTSE